MTRTTRPIAPATSAPAEVIATPVDATSGRAGRVPTAHSAPRVTARPTGIARVVTVTARSVMVALSAVVPRATGLRTVAVSVVVPRVTARPTAIARVGMVTDHSVTVTGLPPVSVAGSTMGVLVATAAQAPGVARRRAGVTTDPEAGRGAMPRKTVVAVRA